MPECICTTMGMIESKEMEAWFQSPVEEPNSVGAGVLL